MSWTAGVVRHVLPNGLTILAQRDASAPVVAVVTHIKAGYFDEPDEWVGIAHVLEHMYFKGTPRRGPGDIARETQLVGGYINAGTIYDMTVYYTVLPSTGEGLERALDVQADALMHTALDPEEFRRELEVIIQEANRKLDSPTAVATEKLYELLYRVHRIRRWRIGTEAGLRRLTAHDVRAYYTSRYTPDRIILGIVGDIDADRAAQLGAETYGEWSRPAAPVEGSPPEPNGPRPVVQVLRGDIERPLASLGWRTVNTLHRDAPALDIAAVIVGMGRGSRLYRAVRLPGLAATTSASHYTPTEVGVFEIALESEGDRIDTAVERVSQLAAALGMAGPSEQELGRARALVATQWARRFETVDGRAAALCECEALGSYRLADELYQRSLEVTAQDIWRVAREHLSPATISGVVYLPSGGRTRLADAWPPAGRGDALELAATVPRPTVQGQSRQATHEVVEYPGGVGHCAHPGADVLIRSKPGSGLVTVLVHVPGVADRETADIAGISWLLARSAIRGAGGMSGEELAQEAELLGGGLAPSVSAETVGWAMTVRADALREAAELLRCVALEPALTRQDVTVERGLQVSDARRVRDDMFRYPLQRVLGQAFPRDAYGLPALGEPQALTALSVDQVRAWSADLSARRAVVVAVGDLERSRMLRALEPLASWPVPPDVAGADRPPPDWVAGRAAEEREKKQTALAMAFPAPRYASADRYPLTVLGALLSGLAGRLFEALREKRSLAYTVAAMPWLARRAGAVLAYVATLPQREAEARDAMLAEFLRLIAEPPSGSELERARNYAAGTVEIRQQAGRAIAGDILDAWVQGTIDELADTSRRLRAVTGDDVTRVATEVFRPELRAEYLVRGSRRP